MPLIRGHHRIEANRHAHLIQVVCMALNRDIYRHLDLDTVPIRIQLDPQLTFVLIVICQRYEDTLALLLDGNVDSMVRIRSAMENTFAASV